MDTTNGTGPSIEVSWTPPPSSELNFTHSPHRCDVATEWLAAYFRLYQEHTVVYDLPIGLTAEYLAAILPDDPAAARPTTAQLAIWYAKLAFGSGDGDGHVNPVYHRLFNFPVDACDITICNKIGWEGDPDVSGIGMMVSYYSLATVATAYFLVLAVERLREDGRRRRRRRSSGSGNTAGGAGGTPRQHSPHRLIIGMRESAGTFLTTIIIFALSMLGAGIVRYVYYADHPEDHLSIYSLMGSVYMATFTILPALTLQAVVDIPRHQSVTLFLWLVVVAFSIALEVLFQREYGTGQWGPGRHFRGAAPPEMVDAPLRQRSQMLESAWLFYCDPYRQRFELEYCLMVTHAVLVANAVWWAYYFVATLVPDEKKVWRGWSGDGREWRAWLASRWYECRPILRLVDGAVCCVLMWSLLGEFQAYRDDVAHLAGKSDRDLEWTFGQMLALATFAPVLVELVTIVVYGPEKALSRRLTKRYEVVKTDVECRGGIREKRSQTTACDGSHMERADLGRTFETV